MKYLRTFLNVGLLCVFPILVGPPAPAQVGESGMIAPPDASRTSAKAKGLTLPPEVDAQLAELDARVQRSKLTDEEKQTISETIKNAAKHQADKLEAVETAQQHKAALTAIGSRAESLKSALNEISQTKVTVPDGTLSELETRLAGLTAERASLILSVNEAEAVISKSAQRRVEIDLELAKLSTTVENREAQLAAAVTAADGTLKSESIIAELRSFNELSKAQVARLQNEKALLGAEVAANLAQLTLDRLARVLEQTDQRFEELKRMVELKRRDDAEDKVEKADLQADELHPVLKPIGAENQRLASLNLDLAAKIKGAELKLNERNEQLEVLRETLENASERVEQVGLTAAVGAMLRSVKQSLPNVSAYEMMIRGRAEEIEIANYDLMDMTDRRNESLRMQVDALMQWDPSLIAADRQEQLQKEARELFQEQRTDYLDPAIRSQTKYSNTLFETSVTEGEIVQLVEQTRRYINENVFWTRSTQPLFSQLLPGENEWWFTYESAWSQVWPRFASDVKRRLMSWCAAMLGIFVLISARYRLRQWITAIGEQSSQSKFTHFYPTFQTLVLTVAATSPIPIFFWFLGEHLASMAGEDRTLMALSVAAIVFASMYALLEFIRQVCRKMGLAECHFNWPPHAISTVRGNLRLLLYIGVPLTTFASFLAAGALGYGNDVLERYFFLGALVVVCIFLVRTFHPRRGAPAHFLARHPDGWVNRLASIWYPAMIAAPVLLGALSVIGYHFTSWQLGVRFLQSIALLFTIGVAISFVMRWSSIHRRRLRIDQLRQHRVIQDADGSGGDSELPVNLPEESAEDLQEQMQQSRNLFQTMMVAAALSGLWLVWSDVVPALDRLDQWPVWTSTTTVTEWIKNDQGISIPQTREAIDPVTYAEIGLAAIIMGIAMAAAANLPGLLEFAVLRRLPIDGSVRYAITTLISYVIILVGLVIAGSTVGVHWNQIQWMATALTFGLAFGLQEMFANFVAGIIILFERPVRVGDVVEIDGVTGIVSKIRIRATTITDWDRKDYIVPNKEFITGKLLNWTRSDEIVRVTINVGVAYGSDTKLTRDLLLKAAAEHPDVLSDPPVLATFAGFGDSCLNFKLRAFVNTYERRMHISHDLHQTIDQEFRKAHIEISFPQRDLHLRSYPEEMVQFFHATPRKTGQEDTQLESTMEQPN